MYDQDSFFTLTALQQFGLLAVSVVFSVIVVALCWLVARRVRRLVAVVWALLLVWLYAWVSPQGYYQYYRLIIDGLPQQNVLRRPPGLWDMVELLGFHGAATLSAHSLGALGWVLLAVAVLRPFRSDRPGFH